MWNKAAVPLLFLLLRGPLSAQVTVAPTIVTTSDRDRFSSYLVLNQTDRTQEVTIALRFGYPAPGPGGSTVMLFDSTTDATRYSMSGWARAFPRRFLLPAGQRQTVRILVTPPADLPEGVYWTRLVTASAPQSPPVDTVAPDVRTQITLRIEQVTTLLFRHGTVQAGVRIGDVTVHGDSAGVHVLPLLERLGNAPFLGSVTARFLDDAGGVLAEGTQILGIYFAAQPDLVLPRARLRPGTYTLEISTRADRSDIPADQLLPSVPATRRLQVAVP